MDVVSGNRSSGRVVCPYCSSDQISPEPHAKHYDGGLGCFGLIWFGFWKRLFDLFGGEDVEMVCHDCGAKWIQRSRGCACCLGMICFIIVTIFVLLLIVGVILSIWGK